MNKEQALELYGNTKLFFRSFYDYTFDFHSDLNNDVIIFVKTGGSSYNIQLLFIDVEDGIDLNAVADNSDFEIRKDNKIIFEHNREYI